MRFTYYFIYKKEFNTERELHYQNEIKSVREQTHEESKTQELRTLQVAYEKMVTVKDKEIKEVEERLQELMNSNRSVK